MTDLSAIRAWFNDPAASNDEACDHIAALLTEIDRLTAERTALLAPVEGVDVEEVLRLDREGTPAPWRTVRMDCGDYWGVEIVGPNGERVTGETRITSEDRDVVERYRTAAPALAREVVRLRARLTAAERERDAARAYATACEASADAASNDLEDMREERDTETRRHECAVTRLSAVRAALLDETGSAPSITDPPDIWSRETRAAVCGAKALADEAADLREERDAAVLRAENAYAEGRADGQAEAEAAADAKP